MMKGKGFFVWRAERVLAHMGTQDPRVAAQQAKAAGIEHAAVKIADGEDRFPIPAHDENGRKEATTAALINALGQEGIDVWGWAFAYGQRADAERQAQIFAQRAQQFGIDGLIINAEDIGNRRWSSQAGATRARKYVARLRQEMSSNGAPIVLGFTSYRFMRYHPNFPFDSFMEGCDIAMPQVYWVARGEGDAIRNLRESYQEYKARFPSKLFIPLGAAYGEGYGDARGAYFWSASPRQIERFMDQARAMRLPAVTFWSWEHAINDAANELYSGRQLWDTIAAYNYGEDDGSSGVGTEPGDITIEIGVNQNGYRSGVYPQFPYAAFMPFSWQGRSMRFARTVADTPSSVWALWRPDITVSGLYDISVWVPGRHATTRRARYQVHGVVGEHQPVTVYVSQNDFYDTWVSLGVYELDAANPLSGQVNLTNYTGEEGRDVAFAAVRWQQVVQIPTGQLLADGFDSPVGTAAERRSAKVWPGAWEDANPFGNRYELHGSLAFHTGADLNLNRPGWDSDRGQPVYAAASGEVTFAGSKAVWGNIIVIRHDPLQPGGPHVYSRSAHLQDDMRVREGQRVQRGQQIGTIGQDALGGPFHLHFDISHTEVLFINPAHWPGLDRAKLLRNYTNPKAFIRQNRP